jgi:hypothetical protein
MELHQQANAMKQAVEELLSSVGGGKGTTKPSSSRLACGPEVSAGDLKSARSMAPAQEQRLSA